MELQALLEKEGFDLDLIKDLASDRVAALEGRSILIKYGGNAMKDPTLKRGLMHEVAFLRKLGAYPILLHGGGPFIQKILDEVGLSSEFHGGHRRTSEEAMKYVEMALKGEVNGGLVEDLLGHGVKAIGISGKDGGMVHAEQRYVEEGGNVDLGHVGDVSHVNPELPQLLIREGFLPVIAPIAVGPGGKSYNVNADMFAGHLAASLRSSVFIVLTDVDGLMADKDDPESLYKELSLDETRGLYGSSIQGGMIPKVEACEIAVRGGVENARIVNGTRDHVILRELLSHERSGTLISDHE